MKTDMGGIIKRIKDRRLKLGYSFQDLAEKTNMSKSTLQRYETGAIKNVPLDKLEILAKALHVTPAYLMGWEEESNSPINTFPLIGDRVKKYRNEKGLSCKELADKVGVTEQDIRTYEHEAKINVAPKIIEALSKELDSSPAYLMGWCESEKEPLAVAVLLLIFKGMKLEDFADALGDYASIDTSGKEFLNLTLERELKRCQATDIKLNAAHELPNATQEAKNRDEEKIKDLHQKHKEGSK